MKITDAVLVLLGRREMAPAEMADRINHEPEFKLLLTKWGRVTADQVYAAMSGLRSKRSAERTYIEPVGGIIGKNNTYMLTDAGRVRLGMTQLKPPAADPLWPRGALYAQGALVQKKGRASWRGRVVGWYHTELTALGYAVESAFEPGSVQIYPETALADWDGKVSAI
jgi:hypothetical protein